MEADAACCELTARQGGDAVSAAHNVEYEAPDAGAEQEPIRSAAYVASTIIELEARRVPFERIVAFLQRQFDLRATK